MEQLEPFDEYVRRVVDSQHCFGGAVWEPKMSSYRPCFPYDPSTGGFYVREDYARVAIRSGDGPTAAVSYFLRDLSQLAPCVGSIATFNLPSMSAVPGGSGSCVALNGGTCVVTSAHIPGTGTSATFVDFRFDRQLSRMLSDGILINAAKRLSDRQADPVDVVLYTTSSFRTAVMIDASQPPPDDLHAGDVVALIGYPSWPNPTLLDQQYAAMADAERPPVRLSIEDASDILQPNRRVLSAGVIREVSADRRHCLVSATAFWGMSGGAVFLLRLGRPPLFIGIIERSGDIYNANVITLAGPHWA